MKNFLKFSAVFVLINVTLWSCNKTTDPSPENSTFVSADLVKTYSKLEFATAISTAQGGLGSTFTLFIRSGVKFYRITYKTKTAEGLDVVASGAFIVPTDITEPTALASYQHGTIFDEKEAPSYFNLESEALLGAFLASTGFYIAMPDYVGYGASKSSPHPYEHRAGLAQGNVDFLIAVKEYMTSQKLNWNKNLLMAGYSQGGYATMATQKLIEEKYSTTFNLKATSCGAGAYNKSKTIESFLKNKTSGEITNNRSYIWVMLTYDRIYKINRTLSSYFKEPYLTEITKNGIGATINKSFDEILTTEFKNGILNGTDKVWVDAIADNDIFDWKSNTITRLYHGNADTYVPYLNSTTALDAMKKKGSKDVTLSTTDKGTHSSTIQDFFLGTFDLLNTYKN